MSQIYSDLHQTIQDKFNEAGIEIMSPHYMAVRDGNATTTPKNDLSKSNTADTANQNNISSLLNELVIFFASVGTKEYYNKSGRPLHREGDSLCRVCFF